MKFAINGNESDIREITVRPWNDQSFWGPDCFQDLEPNFPAEHDVLPGSDVIVCTEDDYRELVDFWTEELRRVNAREIGDCGDYTELTGDELVISAD